MILQLIICIKTKSNSFAQNGFAFFETPE